MPRPRVWLPRRAVVEAYEQTGSLRGAASKLGVSRSVVERFLAEAGVSIRGQREAMDAVRLRRESDQ